MVSWSSKEGLFLAPSSSAPATNGRRKRLRCTETRNKGSDDAHLLRGWSRPAIQWSILRYGAHLTKLEEKAIAMLERLQAERRRKEGRSR